MCYTYNMPKKKKKKWSKTKLNNELWKLVAKFIKKRDNYVCWHCKKTFVNFSAIHCSHILPKAKWPKYKYKSWNLKTLCMHCHLHWWHKSPLEAALWFAKEYPNEYNKALLMSDKQTYKETPKQSYEELEALYKKLL